MKALIVPILALLSACAHAPSTRPVYACTDELGSHARSVSTSRLLAANGRQLSVVASFTERPGEHRGFAVAASWFGSTADPAPADQPVSFIFDRAIDDRLDWLGGVQLRVGSPTNPAPGPEFASTRPRDPNLSPSWSSLRKVIAGGEPLYLVQLGPTGELLRWELIDAAIFPAALRDLQASLERSREMAKDPRRRCSRYGEQQIVI